MLFFTELDNSKRRAKPLPVPRAVFLCLKFGHLWPGGLGNTIPAREIPRAVPFAVINLPDHPLLVGITQHDNCKRNLAMKIHRLKVRDTYYDYHLKMRHRPPSVPIIYLKGYWLNEIGFEIGKNLQVLPGINHLVLTIDSDKSS
jgi:hypothetical protein